MLLRYIFFGSIEPLLITRYNFPDIISSLVGTYVPSYSTSFVTHIDVLFSSKTSSLNVEPIGKYSQAPIILGSSSKYKLSPLSSLYCISIAFRYA